MDIPRPKKSRVGRYLLWGGLVVGAAGVSGVLSQLRRAPPTVDRAGVWVDEVKRGPMLRAVKGPGTLVPEHIRWITADTAGRVERIFIRPGARVEPGTPLMELSNPDVMLQALEAERQLAGAEAELLNLRSTLESQRLSQQASLASLRTDLSDYRRRASASQNLKAKELTSEFETRQLQEKADELQERLSLEEERLKVLAEGMHDRLSAQQAQIDKLRAVSKFRQRQVDSMKVKAGGPGVLQELPLELGQWVTPGTLLAKVVRPEALKAELRIPETQAKDVQLGQDAEIDTRNGLIPGKVSRIAPAASQGTVLVEVALRGELPRGARPDLTVEGAVQLERLDDVLHVGRPAGAQPESTVELFKLVRGEDIAERVKVQLGRASVNTIEVREGLVEGDSVVLSDVSAWDHSDRVRLK